LNHNDRATLLLGSSKPLLIPSWPFIVLPHSYIYSDIMIEMTKLSILDGGKELLNVRNAAIYLGVSVTTIRRWAQSKKIIGLKIGTRGDWRFTKKELSKMVTINT
jgi:excisionase family DNA binding protein